MENLYSVRIIRRENQVVQGVYIKEFWMFCGVYVNEFVIEYDNVEDDHDIVDFNIILDKNIKYLENLKSRYKINIIQSETKEELDLSSKDKRIAYGRKLEKDLLQIPLVLEWDKKWKQDFKNLYNAFVDSDFAYNNYITRMFLNQFDEHMKLTQLEILGNCLKKIYNDNEEVVGLVQRRFAYFNCARKINRISISMKISRAFDDLKIMQVVHQMAINDPKFTMADVLAGLIGLSDEQLNFLGEMYIQGVLEKEHSNKYSAFIYYILAHYYEVDRNNNKKAWELYQNMKNIAPKNYRMLFKHAAQAFREQKYEDSWKKFFKIYDMIGNKIKKQWVQPLELEYYYKCARILNKVPEDISIVIGIPSIREEDIQRIESEDFRESKFMNKFIFNDNLQEIYVWYFRNKMESHRINDIIRKI